MGSPPRTPREEEQRLNMRTLVIASAASATAALVTSRLWIAGTWIAAAMTPVLVALVSELLHRPTERIARSLTTDSPALPDPEAPARRVAERLRADDAPVPDPDAPVRIYRSESARPPAGRKRQIAYRAVFATAALAFVIGVLALTLPELIAGSSFGRNDGRTTLFSGSGKNKTQQDDTAATGQQTTPPETDTTTTPTDTTTTPTNTTPTDTTPTDTTGTTTTAP
jgi:hypothetical protein